MDDQPNEKTLIEETLAAAPEMRRKSARERLGFVHRTLRDIWFYIAAFIAIWNGWPKPPLIQPQLSSWSADNPVDSLFTLVNLGPGAATQIQMTCVLSDGKSFKNIRLMGNQVFLEASAPAAGNPITPELAPTGTATRDCTGGGIGFGGLDLGSMRLDVLVSYRWFWGYLHNERTWHFDTRRVNGRFVLIPDVEPDTAARTPQKAGNLSP